METKIDFTKLLADSKDILTAKQQPLEALCQLLKKEVAHYNWVGFYLMENTTKTLVLGPYAGAKTTHTRIPFGRGICGQVADSGETLVVPDVALSDNYLACSIETKAEIVMPIYHNNVLIGQLDIDSHYINPFTKADEVFLGELCALTAPLLATVLP